MESYLSYKDVYPRTWDKPQLPQWGNWDLHLLNSKHKSTLSHVGRLGPEEGQDLVCSGTTNPAHLLGLIYPLPSPVATLLCPLTLLSTCPFLLPELDYQSIQELLALVLAVWHRSFRQHCKKLHGFKMLYGICAKACAYLNGLSYQFYFCLIQVLFCWQTDAGAISAKSQTLRTFLPCAVASQNCTCAYWCTHSPGGNAHPCVVTGLDSF